MSAIGTKRTSGSVRSWLPGPFQLTGYHRYHLPSCGHVMRRSALLLIMCITLIASTLPASSATRHVVMLFDERLEFPGLESLEAEFVRTLTSNSPEAHSSDKVAQLFVDLRSATERAGFPSPERIEAFAMPTHDRFRP